VLIKHSARIRQHHIATQARRIVWILACLALVLFIPCADGMSAQSPNRVGLIVVHDGKIIKKCITFDEAQISGYDVLERSGLALIPMPSAMGVAICSLDNRGCNYPAEDCFCRCQGSPCIYWSYWHLVNGEWQYSTLGASNYWVRNGDVEGWVWGEGEYGFSSQRPPTVRFEEICNPQSSPQPAPVAPSPIETPTSKKKNLPTIDYFTADRTTIIAGESVTLSWDLHGAKEAYLRVGDQEQGVIAPYSMVVTPSTTTEYVLLARNKNGEVKKKVKIEVIPAIPTPTPTDTPSPTPTETSLPAPTPLPTDTLTPRPMDVPTPTEIPIAQVVATVQPPVGRLPTITPTPTRTATPTYTPVALAAVRATPALFLHTTPEVLVRTQPLRDVADTTAQQLVLIGILSLVGGVIALILIGLMMRWTDSRRPGPSVVRQDTNARRRTGRRG
jgi:hypothetical protein